MRQDRKKTPLRDLRTYQGSRSVRWDRCDYAGDVDVHLTLAADRDKPFADDRVAQMICQNIQFYCDRLAYRLYGYCLMPDHLHVLLSPAESGVETAKWLDSFKSYTTHQWMKLGHKPPLWQRSAHDHVCRDGETVEGVLRYIVENPVRAGLVQQWKDWPWTRAFVEI